MKRNKIFCILASLTMLVAAGASATYNDSYVNQNPVVAEAASEFYAINSDAPLTSNSEIVTLNNVLFKTGTKSMKLVEINGYTAGDEKYGHVFDKALLPSGTSSASAYPLVITNNNSKKMTVSMYFSLGDSNYATKDSSYGNITIFNQPSSDELIQTIFTDFVRSDFQEYTFDATAGESYQLYSSTHRLVLIGFEVDTGEVFPVKSIVSTDGDITLAAGKSYTLNYTVEPANYTDSLTWSSSDSEIVSVDENGIITANSAGDAAITLTADSGISKSWNINVPVINATSITLDRESYEGYLNDSFTLVETVSPAGASDPILWESNNEAVATVVDGVVTLVGEGEATITVSANGHSDTCLVKCNVRKTTSVEFEAETMNVEVWDTFEVKATVSPEDTQETITYKSSDETIAIVENGVVTTLKEGEVTITCESGEYSDTITLNVGMASLNVTSSTDFNFAKDTSDYYTNGFKMYYNKSASGRAQVKDIEFNAQKAGKLKFTYRETGNNKNREVSIYDAKGNTVLTNEGKDDQSDITLEFNITKPGYYVFKNIVVETEYKDDKTTVANEVGTSQSVNLSSITFEESDAQMYYQYDNDASIKAIRFIGTIENLSDVTTIDTITLSFKLNGVAANKTININTIYTSVADTEFGEIENTYYVVYSITGIETAVEASSVMEVTMTITFTDTTSLEVSRSITLGL